MFLVSSFADDGVHASLPQVFFRPDVCRVKVQALSVPSAFSGKPLRRPRVMDVFRRDIVASYKLGLPADDGMVLVSEERLLPLYRPPRMDVFAAFLVSVVAPKLAAPAFLCLLVLIPRAPFARNDHETRVLVLRFAIEDSPNLLHPR